ncbi:MAG: UMP kinase [Archaeoglobaceae archaeon]
MKIVLSLGGSMLSSVERIKRYAEVIDEAANGKKLFVVTGGGKLARELIEAARSLGASEVVCDRIGIAVTRLNATLLAVASRKAPKVVPETFEEAEALSKLYDVVVMGGTFPGHTTDATAALLAEYVGADVLLNATSVDGVYSEDPKTSRDATRFDRLTPRQLVEIVSSAAARAGANVVVDLLAAKIIERSGIKTIVFLGEPENLARVLRGEVIGTVIEAP